MTLHPLPPSRAQLAKLAREFSELTRKAINTWPEAKPWLDADDIAALLQKVGAQRPARCLAAVCVEAACCLGADGGACC